MKQISRGTIAALSLGLVLNGCAKVRSVTPWPEEPATPAEQAERARDEAERTREQQDRRRGQLERERERERENTARERAALREKLKPTPHKAIAATALSRPIRDAALRARGLRIIVSTEDRALWLMQDSTVLQVAPVAVGMHESFTWAGTTYDFKTPHSRRKVLSKGLNPLWIPPDWHYFEKAAEDNLVPVHLKKGQIVHLTDSTRIEVRGAEVGRVNRFGNWWPFTPGAEIIFEGKIFIPPLTSAQRKIPDVLGTHKLEIGNGYLIHGTNQETSVGEAVSHGCVRMYNEDVARLYAAVPVGTSVYIF
ncbi:MAG: L,D-transpeptidase [Gemmatimonadota bacterium]